MYEQKESECASRKVHSCAPVVEAMTKGPKSSKSYTLSISVNDPEIEIISDIKVIKYSFAIGHSKQETGSTMGSGGMSTVEATVIEQNGAPYRPNTVHGERDFYRQLTHLDYGSIYYKHAEDVIDLLIPKLRKLGIDWTGFLKSIKTNEELEEPSRFQEHAENRDFKDTVVNRITERHNWAVQEDRRRLKEALSR